MEVVAPAEAQPCVLLGSLLLTGCWGGDFISIGTRHKLEQACSFFILACY